MSVSFSFSPRIEGSWRKGNIESSLVLINFFVFWKVVKLLRVDFPSKLEQFCTLSDKVLLNHSELH